MLSALIGYSGFVGSNLAAQHAFSDSFNTGNIEKISGREYELIVCAGVSAVKWMANKEPELDMRGINRLLENLEKVKTRHFILVSTIDVYPNPVGVDENVNPFGLDNHAYGKHRCLVEKFVLEKFPECTIVRLPGLFGNGLKKNIIYDLLNDNCLEMINTGSSFQYYFLDRLWDDIEKAREHRLSVINFATEPVPTQNILDRFFPDKQVGSKAVPISNYDFRSIHADLWGGTGGYLYSREEVLKDLELYIDRVKK